MIVVGASLCDGEGERTYTVYDLILFGAVSSDIISHFKLKQTGIIRLKFDIIPTINRHWLFDYIRRYSSTLMIRRYEFQ